MEEIKDMDRKGSIPTKPMQVVVIPLYDYAFPTFWDNVCKFVEESMADSVYCEGFSKEYIRRSYIKAKPTALLPWERWRKQRAPWPWHVVHPACLHGGDTEDYGSLQRLFPAYRPKKDATNDLERVQHLCKRMDSIGELYNSQNAVTLFHHRFAPLTAEILENKGYTMTQKREIEAGNSLNERYDRTLQYLVNDIETSFGRG
eukprot:TRINITY_DN4094_c0_g2_i4.p1 TRINITY_DN4094_c0_g2~~TRINITY_DN4094_c0_g2_i4.p1  ORF type:complete len:202 (+),score=46.35 TRINITY_DN4094_c0_g2_i4:242-847(+)